MNEPAADFRTSDMTLATVLCMEGFSGEIQRTSPRSKEAEWVFERDEKLEAVVTGYVSGQAIVEARKFMQQLTKIRRDLHDFRNRVAAA